MPEPYILSFKPNIGAVSHDQAAAIFEGGELLAAAGEERFTRDKHAIGQFPSNAIQFCLDHANITLDDVSYLAVADDPKAYLKRLPWSLRNSLFNTGGLLQTVGSLRNTVFQGIFIRAGFPEQRIRSGFSAIEYDSLPKIRYVPHHLAHAASTYYYSGFGDANVVTVDGSGEYDSTVLWETVGGELRRRKTFKTPNSIGKFYGLVTRFLGYRMNNGETKIMGMAPYGKENTGIRRRLLELVSYGDGDYDVTPLTDTADPVGTLADVLGFEPRGRGKEFTDDHQDLAYETQRLTEEMVLDLVEHNYRRTGEGRIAVAGGVFLNCKMNKRIMESDVCDELFIQPAAGDDGLAIGAGVQVAIEKGVTPAVPCDDFFSPYLGPEPAADRIEDLVAESKLKSTELPANEVPDRIAADIADGLLVGHFAGRMEFGPRALGNRSILADPRTVESKDSVNEYVKQREHWRPFAPSMLAEAADEYLEDAEESPYMIKTFDVNAEALDDVAAVIHDGDDTTRPQTVRADQNERYYDIIAAFEERTGVPVVLNTSFNDNGEPIVMTPCHAVRDFYSMGLDVLYLKNYRLEK
jgi:carbamoyltransferase